MEELAEGSRLWKASLCRFFEKGSCSRVNCPFAHPKGGGHPLHPFGHGVEELRRPATDNAVPDPDAGRQLRFGGGGAPEGEEDTPAPWDDGGPPPTNWTCPKCHNVNFPRRRVCNRKDCREPRPAIPARVDEDAAIAKVAQATGLIAEYARLSLEAAGWDEDAAVRLTEEHRATLPNAAFGSVQSQQGGVGVFQREVERLSKERVATLGARARPPCNHCLG
eukprot:gene52101-34921_t